jgi:hypothetical protein
MQARALFKRGYTGKLHMLDGKTGKPRTIIDIEKAAQLRTVETDNAPCSRNVACAERPYSPETGEAGTELPTNSTEAA